MNILLPDSWLREYLDTSAQPKDIKEYLSLCGPSVERINKAEEDYIYGIEVTSNRVDMASVYGIAREAAAILPRFGIKADLKPLNIPAPSFPKNLLPMAVNDPDNICNRIMGIVMEVDPMKPASDFMKERLEKSGVRSLNNLVDITNYVMLELGHPCHVFDYDRIKTHKFIIRFAKKKEPIITLDEKKYLLNEEDVIIDDGTGRVIDLPGIMGTENSVVTEGTKRIFFFIESNNPTLIRKTSMRYGIRTMAATINEKHPDPELVKTALLRGMDLYQKYAGGKVAGELIDIYPHKTTHKKITVSYKFINDRLGIILSEEEIINILKSLNFSIKPIDTNIIEVTPPTFRQFDVTIAEDIVEEVARIYGYYNLPTKLMAGEIPVTDKPKDLPIEEKAKMMLKYWGLTEVYNYSFISKSLIKKTNLKIADHLKVANPLTSEIEYMRTSLVPQILQNIENNQTYSNNLSLFELSNTYEDQPNKLPKETPKLVIAVQSDFYHLKGIVLSLLEELGIKEAKQQEAGWQFGHPKQTLKLSVGEDLIAYIATVYPALSNNFNIRNRLFIAEINFKKLVDYYNPNKKYTPIFLYPPSFEDLTFYTQGNTKIGPIIEKIYQVSSLINAVTLKDRFKGSVTLTIKYLNKERNLTNEELRQIRAGILKKLEENYKIKLKV